jgi:hypothetical protein
LLVKSKSKGENQMEKELCLKCNGALYIEDDICECQYEMKGEEDD